MNAMSIPRRFSLRPHTIVAAVCLVLAWTFLSGVLSEAYAARAAIVFTEMEKDDDESEALEETLIVYATAAELSPYYGKFYWLTNTLATKDNLIQTIQEAVNNYTTVDLYIIAHGGMQYLWGHYSERFYVDDILGLKSLDNIEHLRFVYIGSCHSWDLADEFVDAGAVSAVGSAIKMNNFPFYPRFLNNFAARGLYLQAAVTLSETPVIDDFRIRGNKYITLRSGK